MNIDIINTQVAKKLNISQKLVADINKVYWNNIYKHLYSYNSSPITIDYICVLYPNKYSVKKGILDCISKLRNINNTRFKEGTKGHERFKMVTIDILKKLWKIRKDNAFTN